MADQNKAFSELMSPSQLFVSRSRSHRIPVRGQKDFSPDESEDQRRRLEQSLTEHWSLVSEERVERRGNLVTSRWNPSDQVVELQTPAGKFWQTMGFSAGGKQLLLPEEALHLMECGNLQVFHQDLPMSIQDGYETFLSSSSMSLQQYQVFGHLKRLGYVVHRFRPSLEPSSDATQLNLPPSHDRAARRLKRKRSPTAASRLEEAAGGGARADGGGARADRGGADGGGADGGGAAGGGAAGGGAAGARSWWETDVLGEPRGRRPASHRLFGAVPFPDLGSRDGASSRLPPPDPSLLPGALAVGVCDVAPWRHRINLRRVKTSVAEREDRRRREDRQVRRCRNWAEYRELLARRQRQREGRPAHLWNQEVAPLHDPTQATPTDELLDKISVTDSTHLPDGASRIKAWDAWRISFNVYQPDTAADFRKSRPGRASACVCVCRFDDPVPDLRAIKLLSVQSGDVPLVVAVVDHGDVSFYTFRDFQLPKDVY